MSAAAAAATALSELVEEYENMWYKQKRLVERMGCVEEEVREMLDDVRVMQRQMDDVQKVVYEMQKSIDQMKTSIGLIANGNRKIAEHLGSTPEAVKVVMEWHNDCYLVAQKMLDNPDGKDDGKKRKNMNDEWMDEDLILSEISAEEEEEVKQEHQPKKSKKDEGDASG